MDSHKNKDKEEEEEVEKEEKGKKEKDGGKEKYNLRCGEWSVWQINSCLKHI